MKLTKSELSKIIKETLQEEETLSAKDAKLNKLNDAKNKLFEVMNESKEAEEFEVARLLEDAIGALQKVISKIYYTP
tara:strand:+ start:973 stop:1203 length:231 start_codon:yes stop_codon:yes gene_type:complete